MTELMTESEVAKLYRTPPRTLEHWRGNGYGPRSARIGKRVFYRRQDVESWLNRTFSSAV